MSEIKVLVVEDDPLIAEDIRQALTNVDYEVIAVAHSRAEALAALARETPDIVLLDINLDGQLDGFAIAQHLNDACHLPFIYLTSYANKTIVDQAKYTRPMGYLLKPFDEGDLYSSIEIALYNFAQREKPSKMSRELLNQALLSPLTEKEFELLEDIFEGMTNKQLADKHFVSLNTIKTHLKSLYGKLDVHSRTEAMARLRNLLGS